MGSGWKLEFRKIVLSFQQSYIPISSLTPLLINNEIDLLFADIVMGGMNGKKLADNIRVLKPDIKILYTSGYSDNYFTDEDILDNNISFIPKPYSLLDLTIKIKNILES